MHLVTLSVVHEYNRGELNTKTRPGAAPLRILRSPKSGDGGGHDSSTGTKQGQASAPNMYTSNKFTILTLSGCYV